MKKLHTTLLLAILVTSQLAYVSSLKADWFNDSMREQAVKRDRNFDRLVDSYNNSIQNDRVEALENRMRDYEEREFFNQLKRSQSNAYGD